MTDHRYEQIASVLREQIISGELGWGARLPTQDQLQETFAASRPVVRHALDILEREGLIDRVQGGGAFVRRYQSRWSAVRHCTIGPSRVPPSRRRHWPPNEFRPTFTGPIPTALSRRSPDAWAARWATRSCALSTCHQRPASR